MTAMRSSGQGRKHQPKPAADALKKVPQPPAHLDNVAKVEWRRIMPSLIERNILTKADLSGIETYCSMVAIVRNVEKKRKENGGEINVALFGVMNRAAMTARQLASEFGLTPASRAKIGEMKRDDDATDNPLAV